MSINPHLMCDRCAVSAVFKEEFDDINVSVSFDLGLGQLGRVMKRSLAFLELTELVRSKAFSVLLP